ncbi:TVP38/TMEM64 family protein [Desulfosarcina ovata]|nr:TVP38/TMEM64 family protein [Desulfosarcina ovata]
MMQSVPSESSKTRARIKALLLIVFIAGAVVLIRYSPLRAYLTPDGLSGVMATAGGWAPVVYVVIYAVGICLFIPGTLLTGIGAAIFGPFWGFVWVWIGAMIGSVGGFFIGRTLGRDFAASLIGDRLSRYDAAIARNGFATVLYLRLIYFPFTPMNFGMGLTRVRFADYFAGTGLGIVVGTFIFTFFIGTLKTVWVSGNWAALISPKVFFSIGLFVFSFFIPVIIKSFRDRHP